jgi:acyl carrier protein phosphodiesterase
MNYLAHAFLARATPERLTGGLLGDFVKGALDGRYSPAVRAGIALHRAIDGYTDRHPLVQASRARVSVARRRFAGVLVDVFYDHFLARHWSRYCTVPLPQFTRAAYAVWLPQRAAFPERLQRILPRMAAEDWLASYAERRAVDAALAGIARRLARFERARVLRDGGRELERDYHGFEADFLAFFPELMRHVEDQPAPGQEAPDRLRPTGTA